MNERFIVIEGNEFGLAVKDEIELMHRTAAEKLYKAMDEHIAMYELKPNKLVKVKSK